MLPRRREQLHRRNNRSRPFSYRPESCSKLWITERRAKENNLLKSIINPKNKLLVHIPEYSSINEKIAMYFSPYLRYTAHPMHYIQLKPYQWRTNPSFPYLPLNLQVLRPLLTLHHPLLQVPEISGSESTLERLRVCR